MGRLLLLCLLASCGRIGFDGSASSTGDGAPTGDGTATGDGASDGPDGGPTSGIAFVGSPLQHTGSMGSTESVSFQATNAGDALLFMVSCAGSQPRRPSRSRCRAGR